jgi:hypothetical protein
LSDADAADDNGGWRRWQGEVNSPERLEDCIAELGILPVRAGEPWPSLPAVCAAGVTLAEAWRWGGTLVSRRKVFCGRVLPRSEGLTFTSLPLFSAFFALGPGSDYVRAYTGGAFGIEAKAVADLLMARGPLTMQQLRQGMRLHKRFLGPVAGDALAELERALVVVAGGQEMASSWKLPPGGGSLGDPGRPLSKWSRQIAGPEVELRVWDLTVRWAPPDALAAADRLREQPERVRELIRQTARELAPGASDEEVARFLGWNGPMESQ